MKKSNHFGRLLSYVIIVLFSVSCGKNIADTELSTEESSIVNELISRGFKKQDIVDMGDYFLVDGCYFVSKNNSSLKQLERSNREKKSQYWIGRGARTNIVRVYIDNSIPTSGQNNWRSAIQQAIDEYNSLIELNLTLQLVNDSLSSDIIVKKGSDLDNNFVAAAAFPEGGKAGSPIRINFGYGNVPEAQKVLVMVHEFGHCLGLRHTDWINHFDEHHYDYIRIPGTPSAPDGDVSSVMMRQIPNGGWNGFSYFDIVALKYLFPFGIEIEGADRICSQATYSIDKAVTVALENTSIATLTKLNPSQYQVTRVGDGYGAVKLKAIAANGIETSKDITVGMLTNHRLDGPDYLFTGNYHLIEPIFTIKLAPGEDFTITQFIVDRVMVELYDRNDNNLTFKLRIPTTNWNFVATPYSDYFNITVKGISDGCVKYVTKTVLVYPNPNLGGGDGPQFPGE